MRASDVDIAPRLERPLWRDEPVPARMGLQSANKEIHLLWKSEAMSANLNELAGSDQGLDLALERRALVTRDLQDLKELAHAGRVVHTLTHQRQDVVTGEYFHCRIAGLQNCRK